MKKAAIITINDNDNYGNRLQNYAVMKIVESLGLRAENIITNDLDYSWKNKLRYFLWRIAGEKYADKLPFRIRSCYFQNFNRFIKTSHYHLSRKKDIWIITKKYDVIIYGSDQIWNPEFKHEFAVNPPTPVNKNIALCGSFGINALGEDIQEEYRRGLKKYRRISVREKDGAEIIKKLTGEMVPILIDPTMCLSKEEWRKVEQKPVYFPEKKYILLYFLGKLSSENQEYLDRFAADRGYQILSLQSKEIYRRTGPSEFVYLLSHAAMVLTDSFHGCVFSILFHVPFWVLERKDKFIKMNGRIDTLLEKFDLCEKKIKNFKGIYEYHECSDAEKIIYKEKRKLIQFLESSIDRRNG